MVRAHARMLPPPNVLMPFKALRDASCTMSSASARLPVIHLASLNASSRYGRNTSAKRVWSIWSSPFKSVECLPRQSTGIRQICGGRMAREHCEASANHHLRGHVGMERARIVVSPGLSERACECLPWRERQCAADAVIEHESVGCTVIVAPGDAFARVNCDRAWV